MSGVVSRMPTDQRRNELLETAREVFKAKGLAGARVRDIARSARVSEGMLYRYFGSKSALFEEAVLRPLQEAAEDVAAAARAIPEADQAGMYELSRRGHVDLFSAMQSLVPLLNIAMTPGEHAGREQVLARFNRLLDDVERAIGYAMSPYGSSRRTDSGLMTSIIAGTYYWLTLRAELGGPAADIEVVAPRLIAIILRSLHSDYRINESPAVGGGRGGESAFGIGDDLWAVLESQMPADGVGRGGRWRNHRQVFGAIAWKYRGGHPWRALPSRFGAWQTAWRRLERWKADGTWGRLQSKVESSTPQVINQAAWMRRV